MGVLLHHARCTLMARHLLLTRCHAQNARGHARYARAQAPCRCQPRLGAKWSLLHILLLIMLVLHLSHLLKNLLLFKLAKESFYLRPTYTAGYLLSLISTRAAFTTLTAHSRLVHS